jgi:tetratricopeptide (TPR) repeat protein
MLRRAAIILVTGLIVARPLILGEDPTLQVSTKLLDTSSLVLTMFWLVAAAMWGLWRLWARQGTWYGGAVEAALFAVILLTCAGAAFVAPYKHAAWLQAWEWVAAGAGFVLLRQLAVTREEQHCFFAVLLAGAVPLSAYALYQRGVEMPKTRAEYAVLREQLQRQMADKGGGNAVDEALEQKFKERVESDHVYGTFANPNSFAGYLVLVVPGLIGAALLCARHKHPVWQVMVASCFATLGVFAVFLTHSRGALLALVAVGVGVAVLLWRDWVRRHWYYALGAAALLVLAGVVVWQTNLWTAGLGKSQSTAAVRFEYWRNTLRMIRDHPWLGVGPGQFGRYYTRSMGESDGETILEPHNFVLEIWATCGLFAALALVTVFVLWYRQTLRAVLAAPTVDGLGDTPPPDRRSGSVPPVRWEFYVGGMVGLLLAFVLRASDKSPDDIKLEAVMAGVQSVMWFGAFALFERIAWSDRARVLALLAGVTATLLNLLVSGGINFPSVATMLWCAAALALNSTGAAPNAWVGRFRPLLYVPLPALAALAVVYLLTEFYPIAESTSLLKQAAALRTNDQNYAIDIPKCAYLLEQARKADPDNARVCRFLAHYKGELWELSALEQSRGGMAAPKSRGDMTRSNSYIREALHYAALAQALDPEGRGGYVEESELRRLFAWAWEMPNSVPGALGLSSRFWQMTVNQAHPDYEKFMAERKEQYRLAAAALQPVLQRNPNSARDHFQLADALHRAGEDVQAHEHAQRALELDERNNWPTRKLANEQKRQVERWLAEGSER